MKQIVGNEEASSEVSQGRTGLFLNRVSAQLLETELSEWECLWLWWCFGLGKHRACFTCCKLPTSSAALGFCFCCSYPERFYDICNFVLVVDVLKPWSAVFACKHQGVGKHGGWLWVSFFPFRWFASCVLSLFALPSEASKIGQSLRLC